MSLEKDVRNYEIGKEYLMNQIVGTLESEGITSPSPEQIEERTKVIMIENGLPDDYIAPSGFEKYVLGN